MKILLFIFIIILNKINKKEDDFCPINIMRTYNFTGFKIPIKKPMLICPIKITCCNPIDEISILIYWKNFSKSILNNNIKTMIDTYKMLFSIHKSILSLNPKDFSLIEKRDNKFTPINGYYEIDKKFKFYRKLFLNKKKKRKLFWWLYKERKQNKNKKKHKKFYKKINKKFYKKKNKRYYKIEDKRNYKKKDNYINNYKNKFCLNLYKQLKEVKIKKLQKKILTKFKEGLTNLGNLHKSFYCTLCDIELKQFFDHQNKIIYISKDYCKNFINEFKEFLELKYIFLISYLDNIDQYIKCYTSKYNEKPKFKSNLQKEILKKIKIKECLNNYNSDITKCYFICKNYNLGKLSNYIESDNENLNKIFDKIIKGIRERGFTIRNLETNFYFLKKKFLNKYNFHTKEKDNESIYKGPFNKKSINNYTIEFKENGLGINLLQINNKTNFNITPAEIKFFHKIGKKEKIIKQDIRKILNKEIIKNYFSVDYKFTNRFLNDISNQVKSESSYVSNYKKIKKKLKKKKNHFLDQFIESKIIKIIKIIIFLKLI